MKIKFKDNTVFDITSAYKHHDYELGSTSTIIEFPPAVDVDALMAKDLSWFWLVRDGHDDIKFEASSDMSLDVTYEDDTTRVSLRFA